MNTLITKIKSAISTAALLIFGAVMAGLGLATVGLLALFALVTIGMALLAAPFVALSQPAADETAAV
ncbi:MAG: hypothetical protein AAFU41_01555 [Pseudomonadota bacterium]